MSAHRPLVAALALPLTALAIGIALNSAALSRASEWVIPVEGYDPRAPLRGQFIRFRYDWHAEGDAGLCSAGTCQLCLKGAPPDGSAVEIQPPGTLCRYRIDIGASKLSVLPVPMRTGSAGRRVIMQSRLFVSERRASELGGQLATQPMAIRARLTRGGRLVNERLEPRSPLPTKEAQ